MAENKDSLNTHDRDETIQNTITPEQMEEIEEAEEEEAAWYTIWWVWVLIIIAILFGGYWGMAEGFGWPWFW